MQEGGVVDDAAVGVGQLVHLVGREARVEVVVVVGHRLQLAQQRLRRSAHSTERRKEKIIIIDALNTFYLRLYGNRHIDSGGNSIPVLAN